MILESNESQCSFCENEIDPDICWCGDYIAKHSAYEGHSPVPMGCMCMYNEITGKRETQIK